MRRFRAPRWAYDMERRLRADINNAKEQAVSELSDKIAQVQSDLNDEGAALEAEIQQVKDAVAAGTVTADDLAGLDAISQRLKDYTVEAQADDTPPPAP